MIYSVLQLIMGRTLLKRFREVLRLETPGHSPVLTSVRHGPGFSRRVTAQMSSHPKFLSIDTVNVLCINLSEMHLSCLC